MTRRPELEQTRPPGRARGLVSEPVGSGRIESETSPPCDELCDVVARYWSCHWDLRGHPAHQGRLLGDPCAQIVFEAGLSRWVGVWTRLWTRTLEHAGHIRAATVRAGALRAWTAVPAHRWTNRIVPLASVIEGDVASIERAVLSPDDDATGFARLQDWLLERRLPQVPEPIASASALVDRITTETTLVSVEQLAEHAGLTKRAVQRLFREYVGAPPKSVIRRVRLQEVVTQIERGETPNLAQLAAQLGYADQAHLARDFKTAVGRTPSQFAASLRRGSSD